MAGTQDHQRRLLAAAQALEVELGARQGDALLQYIEQLQRWNRSYNLTALRDPEQMLVQHVFDSLSIVAPVKRLLAGTAQRPGLIVDVGSGAGLPGIVLAVIFPEWQVHCIDAVEKKVAFIRQMSGVLQLDNLHAVHARIETLPPMDAAIVVSRAFASLLDFVTLAGAHASSDGHLLAMKGREPQEEIQALERDTQWCVEQIEPLIVPELNAQRCLIRLSRQGTP